MSNLCLDITFWKCCKILFFCHPPPPSDKHFWLIKLKVMLEDVSTTTLNLSNCIRELISKRRKNNKIGCNQFQVLGWMVCVQAHKTNKVKLNRTYQRVVVSKFSLHGIIAAYPQIKLCPTSIVAAWQHGSVASENI